MFGDTITQFEAQFRCNGYQENVKGELGKDIMELIHNEFSKPFIKNLYKKPQWNQRVFWAVAGTLQNYYDDLGVEVSLNQITTSINQYLSNPQSNIPDQRDSAIIIRNCIKDLEIDGFTPLAAILSHAKQHNISFESVNEIIKRLTREGSIFEPKDGHYKLI